MILMCTPLALLEDRVPRAAFRPFSLQPCTATTSRHNSHAGLSVGYRVQFTYCDLLTSGIIDG